MLHQTLKAKFKLEPAEIDLIQQRINMAPNLHKEQLIRDFIQFLERLDFPPIQSEQECHLSHTDATIRAPKTHEIVCENTYVRILECTVLPNVSVPFHSHGWDGIMITFQGSHFRVDDGRGPVDEVWEPVVEFIDGTSETISYQNIGKTAFIALLFEIKSDK